MQKSFYKFSVCMALVFMLLFSKSYAQSSNRYTVTPAQASNVVSIYSNSSDIIIKEIQIINKKGKVVLTQVFTDNRLSTSVDVTKYPAGQYYVAVTDGMIAETQAISVNVPLCPPYCPSSEAP